MTMAVLFTGVVESKSIKKRWPVHVGLVNQVMLVGDLRTVRICQNIRGDKNRSFAEIVVVVPNREPVFLTKSMVHPAEYLAEILPIRPDNGDGPQSRLERKKRQQICHCRINGASASRELCDVGS